MVSQRALGLEQGFILLQAPACAGTKVVTLELGGDLHPKLEDPDGDGRGEALTLLDAQSHAALQYRDLFAKDAQGKELSAWMTVEAGRLSLHVEDAGAAYPVEIDPLIVTQQAKLRASDGVSDDEFGYSVALSGNTALVGAAMILKNGANSGAAYVFQVLRNNGAPCAIGGECASTFCVDGVCCDTACGGGSATDCQACSVAAGTKMDGTCAPRVQGTSCRPSAGGCDTPEVCDGVADSCPADAKVAAGTACRASTGACDVAELCDGLASDCPADAKVAAGTACRTATGACDVAELCDGLASDCPADAKVAAGTACRASTGACDVAELCDGLASDCPTDAKVAAGTICRAATGSCDVAESCDGKDAQCPADGSAPDGMMCTGGVCASGKCVEESSSTSGSSSGESGSAGGASTSSSGGSGGEPQDTGGCACRAAGGSSSGSSHGAGSVLGLFGLGLMVLRRRLRSRA